MVWNEKKCESFINELSGKRIADGGLYFKESVSRLWISYQIFAIDFFYIELKILTFDIKMFIENGFCELQ